MKLIKGLLLIAGISLLGISGVKADPNTDKIKDDIFTAISSIDYTSINVLLSDGTNIDTVDQDGNTPLMIASKVGNARILDIILSHNPDVNRQNNKGRTALMIAAEAGLIDVVKELVDHGAEISIKDASDNTAFTLASKYGHDQVVSFFKDLRTAQSFAK
jgi:ankyrin repeat protein